MFLPKLLVLTVLNNFSHYIEKKFLLKWDQGFVSVNLKVKKLYKPDYPVKSVKFHMLNNLLGKKVINLLITMNLILNSKKPLEHLLILK